MRNKTTTRRGISSVVGTLMMVAVVAVIGSVILFQGLNGINDFNYYLSFLTGSKDSLHENAIIENVHFTPGDDELTISVRNTGTVQIDITKITMVNIDSQELVTLTPTTTNQIISIGSMEDITKTATITSNDWSNAANCGADPADCDISYRIAITT